MNAMFLYHKTQPSVLFIHCSKPSFFTNSFVFELNVQKNLDFPFFLHSSPDPVKDILIIFAFVWYYLKLDFVGDWVMIRFWYKHKFTIVIVLNLLGL